MGMLLAVILMMLNLALGYALAVYLGHDHAAVHAELPPTLPAERDPSQEQPLPVTAAPAPLPIPSAPQNLAQPSADPDAEPVADPRAVEDFAALAAAAGSG